eukprot:gene16082-24630_t
MDVGVAAGFGSVLGAAALGLLLFYGMFHRLPYWLTNLLRLPPTLSCEPVDTKATTFDNTRVTTRLVFVSVVPLFVLVLLVILILKDIDPIPDDWDFLVPSVECSEKLFHEQSAKSAVLLARDAATRAAYQARQRLTDAACDGLALAHLTAAREADTFDAAFDQYSATFLDLSLAAGHTVMATLKSPDRWHVAEIMVYLLGGSMSTDCSTLVAQEGPPAPVVDVGGLRDWDAVRSFILPLLEAAFSELPVTAAVSAYADYAPANAARKHAYETANLSFSYEGATDVGGLLAQIAQLRAAVSRLYGVTEGTTFRLAKESHADHNADSNLIVGLYLPTCILAAFCVVVCLVFILLHRRDTHGDLVVMSDFEDSEANKERVSAYVTSISKLQVENVAETNSMVDNCFVELSRKLLVFKPFVSHSLFEGSLHEDDETASYPGGRSVLYPVRSEIGMAFNACALMTVSTEMFNDLPKQDMIDRRDDIAADFASFLAIITDVVSRLGGVIHHVGSGVITCTWNCTIACDKVAERAVRTAFELEKGFEAASQDDVFGFIPDERLTNAQIEELYVTKPVMAADGAAVYDIYPRKPEKDAKVKMGEYLHCFKLLRDGKREEALAAFELYVERQSGKPDKDA